jgi:hypothetical protein
MTSAAPPTAADAAFLRLAGACAIGAGLASFAYSVAFIGLVVSGAAPDPGRLLAALALLVGASLTVVTFAGVYRILLDSAGGLALLALLLGVTGSLGAAVHGGYDLAVALHPPSGDLGAAGELPHPIDPRGLLTFGVTGIGTLVVAWLIGRQPAFPRALGYLGYLAGSLLVAIYLGRLLIVTATDPLVAGPAILTGFLVAPAWYLWLGVVLRRAGALP